MKQKNLQFESLVRSYYQPLYRYAFWISKSKQIAEDLVQETYTRAWKNIHQLKSLNTAKAWLFTILSRENSRRFARKQLPMVELSEEWNLEHIADKNNDLNKIPLQRAIMKLSNEYRDPIVLQIVGGFTTSEISAVMSLNENTVSTRLFRARKDLRKLMTQSSTINSCNNKEN